jgi:hypothetical protein
MVGASSVKKMAGASSGYGVPTASSGAGSGCCSPGEESQLEWCAQGSLVMELDGSASCCGLRAWSEDCSHGEAAGLLLAGEQGQDEPKEGGWLLWSMGEDSCLNGERALDMSDSSEKWQVWQDQHWVVVFVLFCLDSDLGCCTKYLPWCIIYKLCIEIEVIQALVRKL